MRRLDWSDFQRKNKDTHKAFEDMCRVIFLRGLGKTASDYEYNYNQPGIEINPIYNEKDGKWYGLQCKFSNSSDNKSLYKQIHNSLSQAHKRYKGQLDVVFIYSNNPLQPTCTPKELRDGDTARVKIARESEENGVKLEWVQHDKILDILREEKNSDLYRMYFCDSREREFVHSCLTIDENTFFQSTEFIDLKLSNDETIKTLAKKVNDIKIGVILGNAGTGKTMAMKYLYSECVLQYDAYLNGRFTESQKQVPIPIFIKLNECINGNLEDLIRQRFKDYGLNYSDLNINYFYFLDGLDEVSYYHLGPLVSGIMNLSKRSNVNGIFISSRSSSTNVTWLRQSMKVTEYQIKKLCFGDIDNYFMAKGDVAKRDRLGKLKNSKIINEIDDIFSAQLLWENVESLNGNISKVEIIQLAIDHWIDKSIAVTSWPLLKPHKPKIYLICEEIACRMQKQRILHVDVGIIQDILKLLFDLIDPHNINIVTEKIIDLFFEYTESGERGSVVFKHRRFQEFFLYTKLEREYYHNPSIIRELNILHDRSFMVGFFLKTALKLSQERGDLNKFLCLKLLEYYLGDYYTREYQEEDARRISLPGSSEPFYAYTPDFLYLLGTYSLKELEELFHGETLQLRDAITTENVLNFVTIYHKLNNKDISKFLINTLNINKSSGKKMLRGDTLYLGYHLKGKKIDEIRKCIDTTVSVNDAEKLHKYGARDKRLISLIELMLENELEYLGRYLSDCTKEMLEFISFVLLKCEYINILLDDKEEYRDLKKKFVLRVEGRNEGYYVSTLVVYQIMTGNNKDEKALDEAFANFKSPNRISWSTWSMNPMGNIWLSILKRKDSWLNLSEAGMGIRLVETVYKNYNSRSLILSEWIEVIKDYNYLYSSPLNATHSIIIGTFLSTLGFEGLQVKSFIRRLLNYSSVIYPQTVLFEVYKRNRTLLSQIVNRSMLDKILSDILNSDKMEFESFGDSIFTMAILYDGIDTDRKNQLLIMGIESNIARPFYKAEYLASEIVPYSLWIAYENFWYNKSELKERCERLYSLIQKIENTTHNDSLTRILNRVVQLSYLDIEFDLHGRNEESRKLFLEGVKEDYKGIDLSKVDLNRYFQFEERDAPYNSVAFWKDIIKHSLKKNLINMDDIFPVKEYKYYLENNYSIYRYIPMFLLLENYVTRDKMIDWIIKRADAFMLFSMIQICSLTGDIEKGRNYIDFLLKFCEMLVYVPKASLKNNYATDEELEYNPEQWNIDEPKRTATFKKNDKILITWNDFDGRERFYDEWVTVHTDAYRYEYKMFNSGKIMKRTDLVWVDGYRVVMPIPQHGTRSVKRDDYLLCRIFNQSVSELNCYMILSDLKVE